MLPHRVLDERPLGAKEFQARSAPLPFFEKVYILDFTRVADWPDGRRPDGRWSGDSTTALDENDSGATAAAPGGTGLSLREALTVSEDTVGRQTVYLENSLVISPGSNLPQIYDPVDIIGDGTGGINGTSLGSNRNCLQIFGGDVRVSHLEVYNCSRNGFQITTGDGVEVSRCHIHDVGQYGVFVGTSSNHTIKDNLIERADYCVQIGAAGTLVENNEILDSLGFGIFIANPATGSEVVGNLVNGSNVGIQIGGPSVTFVHNTLVNSTSYGTEVLDPGTIYRFNIVAHSGNQGINGGSGMFADLSNNIFYNTTGGICSSCGADGTNTTQDPLFLNYAGDELRLMPTSDAVDAATNLGYDRNGAGAGLFWGGAPDYGYHEQ